MNRKLVNSDGNFWCWININIILGVANGWSPRCMCVCAIRLGIYFKHSLWRAHTIQNKCPSPDSFWYSNLSGAFSNWQCIPQYKADTHTSLRPIHICKIVSQTVLSHHVISCENIQIFGGSGKHRTPDLRHDLVLYVIDFWPIKYNVIQLSVLLSPKLICDTTSFSEGLISVYSVYTMSTHWILKSTIYIYINVNYQS